MCWEAVGWPDRALHLQATPHKHIAMLWQLIRRKNDEERRKKTKRRAPRCARNARRRWKPFSISNQDARRMKAWRKRRENLSTKEGGA